MFDNLRHDTRRLREIKTKGVETSHGRTSSMAGASDNLFSIEWSSQPGAEAMSTLAVELIRDPEMGGFTARLPDIPAYGEGETEEEAIDDLKEAVHGYIEAFGLEDALSRLVQPILVRHIEWNLATMTHG